MPYRVRTEDGELIYPTIAELSKAWHLGMVDPEDEVLEEGKEKWRKAGTLPFLVQFSPRATPLIDRKVRLLVAAACLTAMFAVYWVVKGQLAWGALFGLGAAMASMALVRVVYSKK
jgi:hypothetical protein